MPATDPTLLSVIIVSYNTQQLTLDCLRSLHAELGNLPAEVFVVDNASTDGSPDAIDKAFPAVRLIVNSTNLGFGAANNLAMAKANGAFLLLLNSDAFPKPGAIGRLLDYLRLHPQVGVVGPRLLNADGSLQPSCHRFPSPLRSWLENFWIVSALPNHPILGDYRYWPHDTERSVDWVVGACMIIRREVFQKVGGFDEKFFMYAEEADWQRRIRGAGWDIAFTPAAQVVHLGGASGTAERARINRHFYESIDYYEYKHYGLPGVVSVRLAMGIGCILRVALWALVWLVPARRAQASAKTRLFSWLAVRQLTHWRFCFS